MSTARKAKQDPPPTFPTIEFDMGGPGGEDHYVYDSDPALLTGDQALVVEQKTGQSVEAWSQRLVRGQFSTLDILLIAFVAKLRENALLDWDEFIRRVAPYTAANVTTTAQQ